MLVPVVDAGVNVAVTPPGSRRADGRGKAVEPAMHRVWAVAPCTTVTFAGAALSVKSGAGATGSANLVVRVSPPPVPVMVTVAVPVVALPRR